MVFSVGLARVAGQVGVGLQAHVAEGGPGPTPSPPSHLALAQQAPVWPGSFQKMTPWALTCSLSPSRELGAQAPSHTDRLCYHPGCGIKGDFSHSLHFLFCIVGSRLHLNLQS